MQIEIEKYALWIKTLSTAYCECSFKIYTNLIRFFFYWQNFHIPNNYVK